MKEEAVERGKKSALTEYSKAVNRAVLRGAIAGYLVYLGGSLIYDLIQGTSSLSPVLGWIVGPLFMIGGAAFGLYTWRRWKVDEKEAQAQSQNADAPGTKAEILPRNIVRSYLSLWRSFRTSFSGSFPVA